MNWFLIIFVLLVVVVVFGDLSSDITALIATKRKGSKTDAKVREEHQRE